MLRSGQPTARRLIVPGLLALMLALGLVAPAFGTGSGDGPTYKAVVAPASAAAGTAGTSTVTLKQLVEDDYNHNKGLGSARITPPAGFVLISASAVRGSTPLQVTVAGGAATVEYIGLRHKLQTAVVTLQYSIPCGNAGNATWSVIAHQTDVYASSKAKVLKQDSASQLGTLVTACRLAFVAGPAKAGITQTITSAPGNPSGPPIQIQLQDGNGNPAGQAGVLVSVAITPGTGTAGALIDGATSASTGLTGLAEVGPTIDLAGRDYQLDAAAGPGIVGATSATFDIEGVAKVCAGACSGTDQVGNTTATVSANSNGGVLSLSVGLDEINCNNEDNHFYATTSEVVSFDVTPAVGRTTITIELASASVDRLFLLYEACFSSLNSTFTNKFGKTIPAGDAGILPWCKNILKPSGGPCVVLKWFDHDGNVFVKSSVPSGDPRGGI